MRSIVVKSKGISWRILLIMLTLSAWGGITASGSFMAYPVQSAVILGILSWYSLKASVEIYFLKKITPFVFYKENQICVRLNKSDIGDLDIEYCCIRLSCRIDGKTVWSQRENSTNLCFIPSAATEKTGKDIIGAYSRVWVITVEAPFMFNDRSVFNIGISYTVS